VKFGINKHELEVYGTTPRIVGLPDPIDVLRKDFTKVLVVDSVGNLVREELDDFL
jgi:hypothetical protein